MTQYRLHIAPAQGDPFNHVLETDSLVIGRSTEADLVLSDRFLSRFHSRLYRDGEKLWLEDLGSRNGTLLNGRPVHGSQRVHRGDSIKLSGSVLTVRALEDSHEPAPAPDSRPLPQVSYPPPSPSMPADASESDLSKGTILFNATQILESQVVSPRPPERSGEADLRRYAERLHILNEVHQALGSSMELDELLDLILDRVFDHLRPELGALYLEKDGELELVAQRSRSGGKRTIPYSRSLVREVARKGMAALVNDLETDARFASADSIIGAGVRSLVAAPLLAPRHGTSSTATGPKSMGMIVLQSHIAVRRFSEEDLELLVSLAGVGALSLRNVALAEEAVERRRLERELALGRRIQEALLPDRLPEVPDYDLYAVNIPSRGVSGDYYQVLDRPDHDDCMLIIADVSGKGVGASLITASLEALSAVPLEDGKPPEMICRRLSRQLYQRTPPEKFATAFFAALEPASGRLRFTNAGHNQGLVRRVDGSIETLETTGLPLGLVPDAEFDAEEVVLNRGDVLMLYTDGFTEVVDQDEEEYGLERLCEVLSRKGELPFEELVAAINEENENFADGVPYADDRTVVLLRRRKE